MAEVRERGGGLRPECEVPRYIGRNLGRVIDRTSAKFVRAKTEHSSPYNTHNQEALQSESCMQVVVG